MNFKNLNEKQTQTVKDALDFKDALDYERDESVVTFIADLTDIIRDLDEFLAEANADLAKARELMEVWVTATEMLVVNQGDMRRWLKANPAPNEPISPAPEQKT